MLSKRALGVGLGVVVAAVRLDAQAWDDSRVRDLVQRATDRRVQQLADSGLVGYQATAHGYLTLLAQVGEGFRELPRVVKADELALEVYWRAPNLSKQRIIGRRDTTLLPTDIDYHRDHLGIVQNNFPAIIRLGDGDEVRDVPHPLSLAGLQEYEFALTDSLRITTPARVIDVYEIKVRPKDDAQPRIIGAVYLDRETAHVVRMAFGFTRSAYLDKWLEDVFVVLENGVVGGRFWLPRRQEIEIRRTLTWLDYPVRTSIRGRWEIRDYTLTDNPATTFFGPEIVVAPPAVLQQHVWPPGRLTDSLPEESRLPTPAEIKRTMDEVRVLARKRATQRGPVALMALGASDFVRFDRTAGLSLGAGLSSRLGHGWTLEGSGRFGFGDHRVRGRTSLGWGNGSVGLRVFGAEEVKSAGDVAERSLLMNSILAQEFGSDLTDYFASRELGLEASWSLRTSVWKATGTWTRSRVLPVSANSFSGSFRPAFDAAERSLLIAALRVEIPTTDLWGLRVRLAGEARSTGDGRMFADSCTGICSIASSRAAVALDIERSLGAATLAVRTFGGAVRATDRFVSQDLFFLGGPVSAPGQPYHSLIGDRAVAQTVEARFPVPFPRISLGRFGRSPGRASLAPHWTNVWMHRTSDATTILRASGTLPVPDPFRATPTGYYRSAGVSLITAFDLLRLDFSRGAKAVGWTFSVDVTRSFWSIL